jgi:hypothetical protein
VSGCLDGHEGRVVSVSGADVDVIWDDGAHSETLTLAGAARPAARELVRVELWDGEAVSFTDARGHRYRDDVMWPGGYPGWSFGALGVGVFLIFAVYVKPLVRRLRRR